MRTAEAKRGPQSESVVSRYDDAEMVKTLKETVCKGSTDAQFRMFVEICKGTGLNPFLKEIWFVPGVGIMAGRDGYLRVANEHPQFDGMETTVERDAQGLPVKATCKVWRKDRNHPISCEAFYNEYRKESPVWKTYKSAMIAKVAEVLALKRSFSINGVVTEDEIGEQAPAPSRQEAIQAAQEVAKRKIAELSYAQRKRLEENQDADALGVSQRDVDAILDAQTEEPPTQIEHDLTESIKQADPDKFEALNKFADLKEDMREATGNNELYYEGLGELGYKKSNEIPRSEMRRGYSHVNNKFKAWKAMHPPMEQA